MPFPDMESLAFFASINVSALHTADLNRQDELLTEHRVTEALTLAEVRCRTRRWRLPSLLLVVYFYNAESNCVFMTLRCLTWLCRAIGNLQLVKD